MNQRERSQVELIVGRELSYTQSGLDAGTEAIYSQNSAQGRLRYGATILMNVRHLKGAVQYHLRRLVEEVRPFSGYDDAFAIIRQSMAACIKAATAKMPRLMEV